MGVLAVRPVSLGSGVGVYLPCPVMIGACELYARKNATAAFDFDVSGVSGGCIVR